LVAVVSSRSATQRGRALDTTAAARRWDVFLDHLAVAAFATAAHPLDAPYGAIPSDGERQSREALASLAAAPPRGRPTAARARHAVIGI